MTGDTDPFEVIITIPITRAEWTRLQRYATNYGSGGFQNFIRHLVQRSSVIDLVNDERSTVAPTLPFPEP